MNHYFFKEWMQIKLSIAYSAGYIHGFCNGVWGLWGKDEPEDVSDARIKSMRNLEKTTKALGDYLDTEKMKKKNLN